MNQDAQILFSFGWTDAHIWKGRNHSGYDADMMHMWIYFNQNKKRGLHPAPKNK